MIVTLFLSTEVWPRGSGVSVPPLLFYPLNFKYNYRFLRQILKKIAFPGRSKFTNAIGDVHSRNDPSKDGVAITPRILPPMVQKRVVLEIDEELGRSAIDHVRSGHGDGASFIFQAIGRFVPYGSPGRLLNEFFSVPPALYHEVVDNAVKNGAVVVTGVGIGEKVADRLGSFFSKELKAYGTAVRFKINILSGKSGSGEKQDAGKGDSYAHEIFSFWVFLFFQTEYKSEMQLPESLENV
jgi:hypothetical protein